MPIINKIPGFRTDVAWKNFLATFCYFYFIYILVALTLQLNTMMKGNTTSNTNDQLHNSSHNYQQNITPPRKVTAHNSNNNAIDGAELVYIPAGEFLMGSCNQDLERIPVGNRKLYKNELPQRKIYLNDYYIYKYDVTVGQYKKFCSATNRTMPKIRHFTINNVSPHEQEDAYPIVNVSWSDARAYAEWAGGQLPTEAQWEKAARGIDGRYYSWGDEWDSTKCNNSHHTMRIPVGSNPQDKSPYGVMDMTGNVSQWCADWYSNNYYNISPRNNPTGPSNGAERVVRGGGGANGYWLARVSHREYFPPNVRGYGLGFRCVQKQK